MARIDGLIILDTTGKPVITSHFPAHPPSYPSIQIDAFNHALKRTRRAVASSKDAELEPVLWVNALARGGIGAGNGLCHLEREGLRFLVPISQEVNPLFAFSFLEAFLDTLQDYLGDVTETTLKDNFDVVYMLIEEMLDEGHPMTMETAMLKEIVLPPSLMRKLLNVAGVSGIQSSNTAPFSAPIPWRRQQIRHANNEIYFDIVERLDAVVDRRGNVLSSSVQGVINANSRLSGNPDLLLSFSNSKVLSNCAFHPCIRYSKWDKQGVLSFIPPDGKFKLLEYDSKGKASVPLSLKAGIKLEESGGQFSLTLTSRTNHRPIEDIVISIYLGAGATSVSATATGDRKPLHIPAANVSSAPRKDDSMSEGHVGGGTWEFDPHTQVLRWSLASLVSTERPPSLTGSFVSSDLHPVPASAFDVRFSIPHLTYSGLKVDQLKVTGDVAYKPFKGVRTTAKAGRMEVRW